MTLTLYRVTEAGDTLANIDADEKILFNATNNVDSPNAFITEYEIPNTTGIGNNQAAEQPLGDHQDLGAVENLYILRGFISPRDKINQTTPGLNPFVDILKKWDDEVKTNDDFKHGRFGIDIDDFPAYDRIPVGTGGDQLGLIWKGITWSNDYAKQPLRADFEIALLLDRGDGT